MCTYLLTITVLQSTPVRNAKQQFSQHNIEHGARSSQRASQTTNVVRNSAAANQKSFAFRNEDEHLANNLFD